MCTTDVGRHGKILYENKFIVAHFLLYLKHMDQNLQEKGKNDRKKKQLLLSSSKYVPYVQKKNTVHGHPVRHKNLISSSARCSFQRRNQKFAPVFHCFVHSGLLLMSAWLPESVSDFSQVGQAVFDTRRDFCIHMAIDTVDDEKTSARPFAAA